MRFLRHLGAVILVVAIVVGGGVAWSRLGASSLVSAQTSQFVTRAQAGEGKPGNGKPGRFRALPPGTRPGRPVGVRFGPDSGMDLGLASMFDPVNLPALRQTVIIEAGAGAAVIILSLARRRWRRHRRRQQAG